MIGFSRNPSLWRLVLLLVCWMMTFPAFAQEASGDADGGDSSEGDQDSKDKDKKKSKVPMQKVLEHKKQFVLYPRVGYFRTLGGGETVESVDQATIGFDLQIGIKQKAYVSIESHLLYIRTGNYGLSYSKRNQTVERYGEKDFTSLTGIGIGLFTKFLDGQEIWTHFGIKAGYLHPFYVPIWLGGDLEKEFRRTRGSYWVVAAAPMAGVLIPLKDPVTKDNYAPVDPDVVATDGGSLKLRFMLGAQISVAFVFAPRS